MAQRLDCIVAGSCVADLLTRPVPLEEPIGGGVLVETDPVVLLSGGITANSGITLARLGMKVGVLSYVGDDAWGPVLRSMFTEAGVDDALLLTHPTDATSTTVVAIDPSGERSFFHCVGAPKLMDKTFFLDRMDVFAQTRMLLLGYYSLMPNLEPDLPEVFAAVRKAGCKTALDASGTGGTMHPLDRILPELDVYVPSLNESEHQTGETDPQKILRIYRECGAPGVVGVKLGGTEGVLLSETADEYVHVESCTPPGDVIDTTGAGDSFYAGLVAGLLNSMSLAEAGRLGCAAAACCVTAVGGNAGARGWETTAKLAGA